ncbi:dihydrolipoamide acetyltransferase family protein [Macrococcus equipercicus]|uniref:Dihydrolipoamide acetyltransferase component of pyruvate dehydrogenase complex n=1 Tax=Macrococcus equipercicus TaxID=69967 RepID=A0A9Q9BRR7_9STAP|nr:dihydrolipoamide acetyltransferase family protein [Macrococcus equipercicus]KAA1040143.1 2-oxo acid dehydrogenase subunit E2 [Macrococcus equipercicus]UTH12909.1 2-oxo acid dehydrogenase subunit E2 [Macrococcus equipercicus]
MDITMPKLGESVHEGTIENWLVKVGDTINEYEPLCEVITDKVTAEVPSVVTGTISEIVVEAGETVDIGTVICRIATDGEGEVPAAAEVKTPNEEKAEVKESVKPAAQSAGRKNNGKFSPVVFKLAGEHGIDLEQVTGTGFEGRVTKKDIMNAIENGVPEAPAAREDSTMPERAAAPSSAPSSAPAPAPAAGETIPVNGVRRAIANKMVQSVTEIPHAWMMIEVDVTELVTTRNKHKNQFKQQEGYNLTFFSFFAKAVAEALKAFPMLNSSWQGDQIVINKDINLSIAVASDDKLYVPVIHHADDLSIKGIAKRISELADKGRSHQLSSADMQGGTFTLNNTGSFGSVQSMGIINHPQAAILQVETIVKRPVIIDGMIAVRDRCNLCLSIDHRILDGLVAGQFLQHVKKNLEQMTVDNTSIY